MMRSLIQGMSLLPLLCASASAQFLTLPAGGRPVSAPPAGLAIDGTPVHVSTTAECTDLPGLTTSSTNDVVIVKILTNYGPVVSVTATGLTFAKRAGVLQSAPPTPPRWDEEWYAIAASSLSGKVINVCVTSSSIITADAFAVSGANTASPFDANASIPAAVEGPSATISTNSADTLIVGGFRIDAGPGPGTGFTAISTADYSLVEYKIVSSPQTDLVVNTDTDASTYAAIADAIVKAP